MTSEATERVRWGRIVALAALVLGLVVVGRLTGMTAYLSPPRIRAALGAAGLWGPVLFVAAFCAGELVHVPGTVFVAASVVCYGRLGGSILALVGALVSLSVSFVVVRAVGGKPLAAIRWRFVRRMLEHLEGRPVRTIALLRLVLWMAPQLNYALALSSVRFRSYVVGSALGLAAPITVIALLFDRLFNR
jgi:uncharacterized membrane protein YdjX (TVP38/TMEM64 family)